MLSSYRHHADLGKSASIKKKKDFKFYLLMTP